MDRIQLSGMSFQGRHGVRDAERAQPQEFKVDIEVECDLGRAGHSDALADTIDYTTIRAIARKVVEGESVKLLETMATRMTDQVLLIPGVAAVSVRIAKRPPSMEPIEAASVHIYRTRA